MIANHQTLNQKVHGEMGFQTELRHLREPSIRIELEGNELMLTRCHNAYAPEKGANASYTYSLWPIRYQNSEYIDRR